MVGMRISMLVGECSDDDEITCMTIAVVGAVSGKRAVALDYFAPEAWLTGSAREALDLEVRHG